LRCWGLLNLSDDLDSLVLSALIDSLPTNHLHVFAREDGNCDLIEFVRVLCGPVLLLPLLGKCWEFRDTLVLMVRIDVVSYEY
jgi:hypothetical protein